MGQTGVIKSPLLLILELLNVLAGNSKPYTGSLESWSGLTRVTQMGQTGVIKSPLLLLLELLNVLGSNSKPYTGSLESWSGLTPGPPNGSNPGHKIADFVIGIFPPLLLLLQI